MRIFASSRWPVAAAWALFGISVGLIFATVIPILGGHFKREVDSVEVAKVAVGAGAAIYVTYILQRRGVVKDAVATEIRACLEKVAQLEEAVPKRGAVGSKVERDVRHLGMRLTAVKECCRYASIGTTACDDFDSLLVRLRQAVDPNFPATEPPEFVLGRIRVAVLSALVDVSGAG